MERRLASDYFEIYDRAFYDICSLLNISKIPNWKHIWFYRYLQLSYSRFVLTNCNEGLWDLKIKENLPDLIRLEKIYSLFPINRQQDFASWWFPEGMRFFSKFEKLEFTEIGSLIPHNKYVTFDDYWNLRKSFENYMVTIYGDRDGPPAMVVGFKISKSKKQILQEFEEFLDKNVSLQKEFITAYEFNFEKSKIQEKTLKDCFRALEVRTIYPDLDLLEVAQIASTLDQSLMGLGRSEDSNLSIRSGISRQIKNAIRISENAARGIFPSSEEFDWTNKYDSDLLVHGGIKNYYDYFDFNPDYGYEEIYQDILEDLKDKISVIDDIN